MLPFLHIGRFTLPTYGLMLATAMLCGVWLAISRAPRYGFDKDFAWRVTGLTILSAIFGSKLGDLIVHGRFYWEHPQAWLWSGGTYIFGFLLGLVVVLAFGLKYHLSFWSMGDCGAPAVALGIAIGRLGCLAAGCDYGRPAHLPWSVTFHDPVAAQLTGVPLGIPLHPSQLYESFYEFGVFLVLLLLSRKAQKPGHIFWTFAVLYSMGRFVLEFFRGDVDRGFWGPLSTSQWLCLVFLLLLSVLYFVPRTHGSASAPTGATA